MYGPHLLLFIFETKMLKLTYDDYFFHRMAAVSAVDSYYKI